MKVDAWKGKRKIKDRWEEENWEVVCQIMADVPSYTDGQKSSTENGFFSLHQRLVFPCVWAAVIHRTGVPAPLHARVPLLEVMKRGCHKRKMVRQSPDDLPVKFPWGGKMGSCSLYHGCLPEHPLRTGEDHR